MSELEKAKKEFNDYCKRIGSKKCVVLSCSECLYMFYALKLATLKSEAVEAIEGLKGKRTFYIHNMNVMTNTDEDFDAAIKKIEGL